MSRQVVLKSQSRAVDVKGVVFFEDGGRNGPGGRGWKVYRIVLLKQKTKAA